MNQDNKDKGEKETFKRPTNTLSKEVLREMDLRLKEAYEGRELQTRFIKMRSTTYVRVLRRVAREVCSHLEHDVLKSPGSCAADPAFLVPSSLTMHYGRNVRLSQHKHFVVRTAYALDTGTTSTGIYQKQRRLRHMFPDMERLRQIARDEVKKIYPELDCEFNQCSINIYFDGKVTNDHTNITFADDHSGPHPDKINSQKPNTPVAICTIGDQKLYRLRRFIGKGEGTPKDTDKDINLLQKNYSLLAAHPADEELNTWSDSYRFWLKHSSRLVDDAGTTMSITFRVTQVNALVDATTNKLINPKVHKEQKPLDFKTGIKTYNNKYREAGTRQEEILKRIRVALRLEH